MKPLRLIVSAFGPFPDRETVDFRARPGGPKLIAGDTRSVDTLRGEAWRAMGGDGE